ncbi:AraC family transcriptional regulator [Ottowia sp.]|jgi:AraC-like DNA-binding protein|uniref:helix-turn-helix transcriptional regulator n=1 Tax=Ottowia sp. TaxID=1898956 RepID=UPI0025D1835B|nr:AraC family transcriptional regulator [Ottowia sp.]MBK6613549.1 AraC family transcriptional regulator [Ottowia sp.]MBK6747346.1 AraC family transcriptional regulator [Ottowia sp.]
MLSSQPTPLLAHFHTGDLEPSVRREAWSDIAHRYVDFRPAPDVPLEAELTILASDACTLGTTRSSAYEMRTGSHRAQPDDMVALTLMQSGDLLPDAYPRKRAGALSLCAPREAGAFRWGQGARQVFLTLPRRDVAAALGREPRTLLLTAQCALAPALASQMNHMALLLGQSDAVDATEYAGLLDATRALALLTLRNLGRQGAGVDLPDPTESLHAGRHAAALRFMAQHAQRHDLDAAAIARGAGCSRSRLYEAFTAQGQTVMGTLRELRMQRARALIEQDRKLHVGALSWRCGFADQSDFSKLFRARFGLSPSDWHRRAWADPGVQSAA